MIYRLFPVVAVVVAMYDGGNRVDRCRMNGVSDLLDDGVEAVVVVGGVLDNADRAVGFVDAVGALDDIPVALLVRRLYVTGVGVVHTVVVGVFRVGL